MSDWGSEDEYARRQKKKEREGQGCVIALLVGGGILSSLGVIAASIVRVLA